MRESLGARVGRIISGGLNALVDAMEDAAPESVMEEAIREIDGVIADARRELGAAEANAHLATKRHAEESNRLDELNENIRLALDQNRDDLAEAAVEETLAIEDQLPVLSERIKELGDERAKLEGYIRALQSKKREMHAELQRVRKARTQSASSETDAGTSAPAARAERDNRVERASSAFDRVYERMTGLQGVGDVDSARRAKLTDLDDLAHKHRVAERLQRLKANRGE